METTDKRCIWAIVALSLFLPAHVRSRSPFRTPDPLLPKIEARWNKDNHVFSISDSHLEAYPYFALFDEEYLQKHAVPHGKISFRNSPDESVEGTTLISLINTALNDIEQKKKNFTHFTVIQDKDFNKRKRVGLIILKFNDYPFIVKLFIETPASFVRPFDKGFEPIWFFFMGGGTSRHLNGFTRIKNLHHVKKLVENNKRWSSYVDFPRKWFWMPEEDNWIEIRGYNIGTTQEQHKKIPSIYCILTDAIEVERHFSLYNRTDRSVALALCNDLEQLIDPHLDNFIIEKGTNKLVVIDTEHFPSVVGFTTTRTFNSYTDWYTTLMRKCVKDIYGRTKRTRRQAQFNKNSALFLT